MGSLSKNEIDHQFDSQNDRISDAANVWLDQDPGNDDAVALYMCLFSKQIDVVGYTITGGNTDFNWCLKNAKNLLAEWGFKDLPLYRGAEVPLSTWEFNAGEDQGFHGDQGLANSIQEHFRKNQLETKEEVGKTLVDMYHGIMALQQKVTYVITGPATTFALLIKIFPEVIEKIERVVIMGSSLEIGNITEHAEFNAFCDPEALEIVANSQVEKVIYGLEPLDYVSYGHDFIEKVRNHGAKQSWMVAEMLNQMLVSYKSLGFEDSPVVCYDAAVIPSLVKRNYAKIHPVNMKVLKDGEKRGKTVYEFVKKSRTNMYTAKWCDVEKWYEMMFECLDNELDS